MDLEIHICDPSSKHCDTQRVRKRVGMNTNSHSGYKGGKGLKSVEVNRVIGRKSKGGATFNKLFHFSLSSQHSTDTY